MWASTTAVKKIEATARAQVHDASIITHAVVSISPLFFVRRVLHKSAGLGPHPPSYRTSVTVHTITRQPSLFVSTSMTTLKRGKSDHLLPRTVLSCTDSQAYAESALQIETNCLQRPRLFAPVGGSFGEVVLYQKDDCTWNEQNFLVFGQGWRSNSGKWLSVGSVFDGTGVE